MPRGLAAVALAAAACNSPAAVTDAAGPRVDAAARDAARGDASLPPTDRDRLLQSYLAYLQAHPGPMSNGLDGAQLATTCALWDGLPPSAQAVFSTLTSRLAGGVLAGDGSPMLTHVTRLYRIVGGTGATATAPGSCGGGEANRMFMATDPALHAALVATHADKGGPSGARDIADRDPGGYWRDSHDAGGPHAPFDQSDETNDGAPRGQVQYFADPTSVTALAPLGRVDVEALVEPAALEMDQDYDCTHNSNPACTYTLYGPLCAPEPAAVGVAIYEATYGPVDLTWRPAGC